MFFEDFQIRTDFRFYRAGLSTDFSQNGFTKGGENFEVLLQSINIDFDVVQHQHGYNTADSISVCSENKHFRVALKRYKTGSNSVVPRFIQGKIANNILNLEYYFSTLNLLTALVRMESIHLGPLSSHFGTTTHLRRRLVPRQ